MSSCVTGLRPLWKASVIGAVLAWLPQGGNISGEEFRPTPKYGSKATRLFHAQDYVRHHEAPDFWALMPYYVAQQNERSCSVASVVMMINAIRAGLDLDSHDELITQAMLLEKVGGGKWKFSVGPQGQGVLLEDLARYVRETLRLYGPRDFEVEVVRLRPDRADRYEHLRAVLVENEKSADDFVLAVFWQAELTDDPEGNVGHIAPVGAFDEEHDSVLILDPDRQWYEPYWVPLKTLVDGMTKITDEEEWLPRGYLRVKLKP